MQKNITPIKAIRSKCLECTCRQTKEVKRCTVFDCPIWAYRMGRRPWPEDLEREIFLD
jgi:hypothetical protein